MSSKLFFSLLRSLAITAAGCLLLLLLSAAVLCTLADPPAILPYCAYAAFALGACSVGFLSVKFYGRQGLLCGALSGFLYAILLLIAGLLLGMENAFPALPLALAAILLSALFGYLALPKAPSADQTRKRALLKARSHAEKQLSSHA